MAIGAILGQTFNAGNGIDINARDILAKLSSDADNGITFGSDGGLFVEPAGGKRTCRFVVGTSTAGWTSKDCDYLCDGTADDVEIEAAIQALPSNGGEVIILDGTYNISSTIFISKNNCTIVGTGVCTILNRTTSSTIFSIFANNIEIANMQLSVANPNYRSINGAIESYSGNSYGKLHNLYINNFGSGFTLGDNYLCYNNYLENVGSLLSVSGTKCIINNNVAIKGSAFTGNDWYGIRCNGTNKDYDFIISNNSLFDFPIGIYVRGANNILICNNNIVKDSYTSSQYSINLDNAFSKPVTNSLVIGNLCMGKAVTDSGTNNTIVNNKYN